MKSIIRITTRTTRKRKSWLWKNHLRIADIAYFYGVFLMIQRAVGCSPLTNMGTRHQVTKTEVNTYLKSHFSDISGNRCSSFSNYYLFTLLILQWQLAHTVILQWVLVNTAHSTMSICSHCLFSNEHLFTALILHWLLAYTAHSLSTCLHCFFSNENFFRLLILQWALAHIAHSQTSTSSYSYSTMSTCSQRSSSNEYLLKLSF